jgi:hypothetical protein
VSLKVPSTADIFEPVTLICEYDLESRNLYSVKWYKDECEFFRYMPDYEPHSQAFPTPGITLDVSTPVISDVCLAWLCRKLQRDPQSRFPLTWHHYFYL